MFQTALGKVKNLFVSESSAELTRVFPDSIQLNRNSTGYTWSIKLRSKNGSHTDIIEEIDRIDLELRKKYRKDSLK